MESGTTKIEEKCGFPEGKCKKVENLRGGMVKSNRNSGGGSIAKKLISSNMELFIIFCKNHYGPHRTMLLVEKKKIKFWPGNCADSGDGVRL